MTVREDKKKFPPIRDDTSSQKKAAVDSPERKQETIGSVFVTETNKSSEDVNSTGSESDLPVTQVKMSTPFVTELEYLLTN